MSIDYQDHVGLWGTELKEWVPDTIFDAHVHLGSPEVIGKISNERMRVALTTFTSFTWEEAQGWYHDLYSNKKVVGLIAFPFPLFEVNIEAANSYLIELMKGK